MDENIISSLIERVQAGMNELSPLIRQISDCMEKEQFVTEQTKDAVIQSLSNLSELQLQLTRMLNQSGHTKDMTGLTEAREAWNEIMKAKDHRELVHQLQCVIMEDEEDQQSLSELIDDINKAIRNSDFENISIAVGRAFIHDLKNKQVNEMKTIKEFKKSFAFLRIAVYDGTAKYDENRQTDLFSENSDESLISEETDDVEKSEVSANDMESAPDPGKDEAVIPVDEAPERKADVEPEVEITMEGSSTKKKFSISECMNLVTMGKYNNARKPHPVYYYIIKNLDLYGSFSLGFLYLVTILESNRPSGDISANMEKLVKHDVLRKMIANGKTLYFLSENGKKLFENKTFRQVFFKNIGLHYNRSGERFETSKYDVAATLALEEIFSYLHNVCPENNLKSFNQNLPGLRMFDYDSRTGAELFICVLMNFEPYILTEFKRALFADNDGKDDRNDLVFVIGSTDLVKCKSVFSEIETEFNTHYSGARVIFFSFNDHKYFDIVSGEEVSYKELVDEYSDIKEETAKADDSADNAEATDSEPDESGQEGLTEESSEQPGASVPEDELNDRYLSESMVTNEVPPDDKANDDEENRMHQENGHAEDTSIYQQTELITYDTAKNKAEEMLISDAVYSALAYLKMACFGNSEVVPLYELTAYALDDPMMNKNYSSNVILTLIEKFDLEDPFVKSLLISASMRTVFYNDSQFDYAMKSLQSILPDISVPEIHTFIQRCIDFKDRNKSGFDLYCDYRNKEQIAARKEIEDISKNALVFYKNVIDGPFREKVKIKRYRDTYQKIFDRDGLLAECLRIVSQNEKDEIDFAGDFISEYLKGDVIECGNINEEAVNKLIDDTWEECCENKVLYHSTPLMSGLRAKLKNRIIDALIYIARWVHNNDICDSIGRTADDSEKSFMMNCLESIRNSCQQERSESRSQAVSAGYSSIEYTCENLISRINGSYDGTAYRKFFYINMLKTGDVMLRKDDNGAYIPDLNDYCYGISGYRIKDRILRNYDQFVSTNGFEKIRPDIDDQYFCDLLAAGMLVEYHTSVNCDDIEMSEVLNQKLASIKDYERQLNRQRTGFIEELELKKSYGVFDANNDDDVKELLLRQSDEVYQYALSSQNYGFYQRALNYIRRQIEEDSKTQKDRIQKSLSGLLSDETIAEKQKDDVVLREALDKARLYMEDGNYTAAEDLINRINSGDLSSAELKAPNPDLSDFQSCYREMYDACYYSSGFELKSAAKTKKLIERYSRAMKDAKSATRLVNLWISNSTNQNKMQELLSMLGMDCTVVSDFEKGNYNHSKYYFDCILKGDVNTGGRFSHVIAPFGSLAHKTSFRTLCLFGKNDDERLFNEIDKLTSFMKSTIIFVDYTFNEQFRRELSDRIKRGKYGEIYMVVDRVMFLYLVTHYQTESIIRKFVNVAMPYSYYQPYIYDSMSKMPPEMFFGRTEELQKIEDRNGIHLLYGGRQLGKSALLKRAKLSINAVPGQRALYIDIKNKTVPEASEMICEEMISLGLFTENQVYDDWKSLCKDLKESIIRNKITYFLLLLDEGDIFINDCAAYSYSPIEEMKRIMESVDFKFVIAGLHNLARYDRKSAMSDNSVIPHLKTLTIKPFKNMEARKLLEVPLAQVGLFFNNDALISTILATTNYFPGLIQLYCSKLITSLQDIDKTIYPITSVPPYYINEKHIQKVLANEEFTHQIKEKFDITLELDNDNYYQIIALLMAEMYHSDDVMNHSVGYSADEVYARGCEYEIHKISSLDPDVFTVYMDELVELNIFRKHPDNSYTFLRQNFFQLMGNSDEIYDRLQKYIDE